MWWWSDGSSWFPWLLMPAFMVVCALLMAWMMRGTGSMCGFGGRRSDDVGAEDAERILRERLARGEIDVEEHDRLRGAIRRP